MCVETCVIVRVPVFVFTIDMVTEEIFSFVKNLVLVRMLVIVVTFVCVTGGMILVWVEGTETVSTIFKDFVLVWYNVLPDWMIVMGSLLIIVFVRVWLR